MIQHLKILVLTPGIYPDVHSGLPKLVYNMAYRMREMGHEIFILTRQYQSQDSLKENYNGMNYYRIPIPKSGDFFHKLWPLITPWKAFQRQKEIAKEHGNFDIVWVHNPWWMAFYNLKKLWPQTQIFYDFHSDAYTELTYNHHHSFFSMMVGRLFDWLASYQMKKADKVVVHSHYTKEICRVLLGSHQSKIRIVNGGADPKIYYPIRSQEELMSLRKALDLPFDKHILITARGLKPRTGVDKLIQAVELLEGVDFFLLIIGRGVMQKEIEALILSRELTNRMRLISDVSEEKLAQYYRAADTFVLPTQGAEGFGLATVEALASGLIVLGTNNSATPELLRRYHPEWIIAGAKAECISKKMQQFCTSPGSLFLSSEHIRKITEENFTWEKASKSFLDIYNESYSIHELQRISA